MHFTVLGSCRKRNLGISCFGFLTGGDGDSTQRAVPHTSKEEKNLIAGGVNMESGF